MPSVLLRASDAAIHEVDERYLSFTIDLGQIAEPTRFWNPDGSGETIGRPTFDFASERMRNMAAALAPAFLRIGGTEADRVLYALDGAAPEKPPPPFKSVLSAAHVDALGTFAVSAGLHVSFTVNAGWGARTGAGVWESTQTRALMRYVAKHDYPFNVWELCNEPNAWPLFQKNLVVEPEDYARDLLELGAARDAELPTARIAGPSTAYWPIIGEVRAAVHEPGHAAGAAARATPAHAELMPIPRHKCAEILLSRGRCPPSRGSSRPASSRTTSRVCSAPLLGTSCPMLSRGITTRASPRALRWRSIGQRR